MHASHNRTSLSLPGRTSGCQAREESHEIDRHRTSVAFEDGTKSEGTGAPSSTFRRRRLASILRTLGRRGESIADPRSFLRRIQTHVEKGRDVFERRLGSRTNVVEPETSQDFRVRWVRRSRNATTSRIDPSDRRMRRSSFEHPRDDLTSRSCSSRKGRESDSVRRDVRESWSRRGSTDGMSERIKGVPRNPLLHFPKNKMQQA